MPSIMYTYQDLAGIQADAATIKSLNIDVVMNYYFTDVDASSAGTLAYLDALQVAGLKGLIRLGGYDNAHGYTKTNMTAGDYTALTNFVNALKNHPALYGWYVYDEPTTAVTSGQLLTVYNTIKAADPNHKIVVVYPGYGTGFWSAPSGTVSYPYNPSNQDLFGIDTYPIDSSGTYGRMSTESMGSYAGTRAGFQAGISDSITNVTDRTETFFVMQAYVNGAGLFQPSATLFNEMLSDAAAAGWLSKGIAFWMWSWDFYAPGPVSCLKQNSTAAKDAIAAIAAQYHEDLYGTATSPAVSRATMSASFR